MFENFKFYLEINYRKRIITISAKRFINNYDGKSKQIKSKYALLFRKKFTNFMYKATVVNSSGIWTKT